ncbi:MAG TPA: methyltransferase domain-containing protein [Acidimicrobiales bacterium]|nr:methyltransferase domain-containing protein [Acidimicrobiales bacterium]
MGRTEGAVGAADACPLCGSGGGAVQGTWRYDDIWAALEAEFGTRFTAEQRRRLSPADSTELVRCGQCGLDRFHPAVAGDAGFYESLSASERYYESDRWEFHVARELVGDGDVVVDVGAGRGHFLRSLGAGVHRFAVETNPAAARDLRAAGVEVGDGPGVMAPGVRADLTVFFQVLEHLEHPADHVRAFLPAVAVGGRVVVSVPNRDRIRPRDIEPLDLPPHHLTRWSAAQLRVLGAALGLHLEEIRFEPPDESRANVALTQQLLGRYARLGGLAEPAMRLHRKVAMWPAVYRAQRRSDRLLEAGCTGHTMLAVYRAERCAAP